MSTFEHARRFVSTMRTCTCTLWLLAVVGLFAPAWPAVGASQGAEIPAFTASGTVSMEVFDPASSNSMIKTVAGFDFRVRKGSWEIDLCFTDPKEMAGTRTSCRRIADGVRLFSLFGQGGAEATTNGSMPFATALPIGSPPPNQWSLLICWLTLCPNPELPIIDAKRMRRFLSTDLQTHPKNQGSYVATYLGPANAFLSELTVVNDGLLLMSSGESRQYGAPYERGFTETKYEVNEHTNCGGVVFPLRSTLKGFAPKPRATKADELGESVVAVMRVERLRLWDDTQPVPTFIPKRVLALDVRPPGLPNGMSVNHMVTDDNWKPVTDRELVQLAAITRDIGQRRSAKRSLLIPLVFVVLAFVPGALLFFRSRRNVNANKQ